VRSGPRDALLADAAPLEDRGRAFGLQRSMDHLGAALGPALAAGALALLASRSLEARLRIVLGNSTDAFLLAKAREVGWSAAAVPLLWCGHHVLKALTGVPGSALSDRVPRARVVAAGWAAYALYAGFALARDRWQIAALFAAYAATTGSPRARNGRSWQTSPAPPGGVARTGGTTASPARQRSRQARSRAGSGRLAARAWRSARARSSRSLRRSCSPSVNSRAPRGGSE